MNAEFREQFVHRLSLAAPDDRLILGVTRLIQELRDNEVVATASPDLTSEAGQFARGRLAMALDLQQQWEEALRQADRLRPAG